MLLVGMAFGGNWLAEQGWHVKVGRRGVHTRGPTGKCPMGQGVQATQWLSAR